MWHAWKPVWDRADAATIFEPPDRIGDIAVTSAAT